MRAIRHGVDPDSKSLLLMPAEDFYYFSDADLGAIIAYVKSVPPVDHTVADPVLSIPARVLAGTGALNSLIVASTTNQTGPRLVAPQARVTTAYGQYLVEAHVCQSCHGPQLAAGANPDPNGPPVPNLTPGGDLRAWSAADFAKAIRTGVTPSGKTLSTAMP